MRRITRSAGRLGLILVLVGCGSSPTYQLFEVGEGSHVIIGPRPSGDAFPEALLEGALQASSDNCVGVQSKGGFVPVTFPFGTTVLADDPLVLQVLGNEYRLGDSIALGGGFTSVDLLVEQEGYPNVCAGSEVFGANPDPP